jgi:hypothetical protein
MVAGHEWSLDAGKLSQRLAWDGLEDALDSEQALYTYPQNIQSAATEMGHWTQMVAGTSISGHRDGTLDADGRRTKRPGNGVNDD